MKKINIINERLKRILVESYRGVDPENVIKALSEIKIERCRTADHDHYRDPRVFAHTGHKEGVICVSSSIEILEDENIYGVLAHEYGHLVHDQFPELVDDTESYPGELGVEIDREYEIQFVNGIAVDAEIFADWIIEKVFQQRIWYDQRKIQWLHIGD